MTKHFPLLKFYTKENCQLCDVAFRVVERAAKKIRFTLETVDITQSDELMMKYGIEIPVIEIDGNLEFKNEVTEKDLLRSIKKYSAEYVT